MAAGHRGTFGAIGTITKKAAPMSAVDILRADGTNGAKSLLFPAVLMV